MPGHQVESYRLIDCLIENFAMLFTLSDINELTTSMAFYFAIIKFTIVLITLLLIFFSLGVGLFKFTIKD